MSQAADPHAELPPEVDEELVAYLDGELDEQATRRVEARLAADAGYRRELARLQTAWDCLDALPETAIDPSFTRSTIEMVALAAEAEVDEARRALPRLRRGRWARLLALLMTTAAVGFGGVTLLWPSPARRLAQDLPVLENLDLYLPIDSIDYLRGLGEIEALRQLEAPEQPSEDTDSGEPDEATPAARTDAATASPGARLANLTSTEKTQLAASQQRFNRLQPAEQARLRTLAGQVAEATDRARLEQTLEQYHRWLANLSPGQQADLAGLAPSERLQAVEKLVSEHQARRMRELAPPDQKALLEFLNAFVRSRRDQWLKEQPESRRRELGRWLEQTDSQQQTSLLMMMFWQRSRSSGEPSLKFPIPGLEDLQPLLEQLSPAARRSWEQQETNEARQRLLQSWASTALRRRMMERGNTRDARQLSQEQLEQFFAHELSSEQRSRLLALPREEMDQELRRLMLDEHDGRRWRGFEGGRTGGFDREPVGAPPLPGEPPERGPGGFRPSGRPQGSGRGAYDRPERGDRLERGDRPAFVPGGESAPFAPPPRGEKFRPEEPFGVGAPRIEAAPRGDARFEEGPRPPRSGVEGERAGE